MTLGVTSCRRLTLVTLAYHVVWGFVVVRVGYIGLDPRTVCLACDPNGLCAN